MEVLDLRPSYSGKRKAANGIRYVREGPEYLLPNLNYRKESSMCDSTPTVCENFEQSLDQGVLGQDDDQYEPYAVEDTSDTERDDN